MPSTFDLISAPRWGSTFTTKYADPQPGLRAFRRRRTARPESMDRCVDCGRVLLSVDGRCLPSAATTAAETPATTTTGGAGQFSSATGPRTSAHGNPNQCTRAVDH